MIKFIKNLLGLGPTQQETVQEILTPQAPYKIESPVEQPKPVKQTSVAKPKAKSKPKVTEGKTKGGNGAVKKPKASSTKPKAPAKPKTKK